MKKRNSFLAAFGLILCLLPAATGCSRIDETASEVVITSADSLSVSGEPEIADDNYIYCSLDEKEKEYYNLIRDAAADFKTEVIFPEKLEPDTIKKLFMAVYYQEEEIFWLHSLFFRPSEATDKLQLAYRFGRDEAMQMQEKLKEVTDNIFAGFDESTSDYEKLKTFHDHIVLNCSFSMDNTYVNTLYGVLVDGYAQCEGYAFAFDYLCSLAGIECFTAYGTSAEDVSHAWNIVKLDDMWYHVDCTWDDPFFEDPSPEFLRYYYFLVCDSDIIGVSHFPDNTYFSLPYCSDRENYYSREGFMVSDPSDTVEIFKQSARDALDKGIVNFGLRFSDKKTFDKAYSLLFEGKKLADVIDYVNSEGSKKVLTKKYIRYSNEDELIIHVALIYEE